MRANRLALKPSINTVLVSEQQILEQSIVGVFEEVDPSVLVQCQSRTESSSFTARRPDVRRFRTCTCILQLDPRYHDSGFNKLCR